MKIWRIFFLGVALVQTGFCSGPKDYIPENAGAEIFEPWRIEEAVWDEINSHPNLSNAEMRRGCGMEVQAWDAKLMYAYVNLLAELSEADGLKLAQEQEEWQKRRSERASPFLNRNEFGAEGVLDYAETYDDLTRWRIARLEERRDEIGDAGEMAKKATAPAMFFPEKMGLSLEPEVYYERLKVSRQGDMADGLSEKGWTMMQSIWNAKLLSSYIKVLRTLTAEAGQTLAEEQTRWYAKRAADEDKQPDWKSWKQVTQKRIADLEGMMPPP